MKIDKINKYETPVIMPLGELAKGSGACVTGSGGSAPGAPGNPHCNSGSAPSKNGRPTIDYLL